MSSGFRGLGVMLGSSIITAFVFSGLDWLTGFAGGDPVRDFAVALAAVIGYELLQGPKP